MITLFLWCLAAAVLMLVALAALAGLLRLRTARRRHAAFDDYADQEIARSRRARS